MLVAVVYDCQMVLCVVVVYNWCNMNVGHGDADTISIQDICILFKCTYELVFEQFSVKRVPPLCK